MEYKEHLRRLAMHDNTLVGSLTAEETPRASALDGRTTALVRVAATIALDAASASFQHAVAFALDAGATPDEIVATLEAVTPVTGTSRVVASASEIAPRLGYGGRGALEELDP